MGKGRPLTEFEKNLREEIFKRDNHIENSVKYAIDRGDDYGVLKNTPRWRRDAIEKYKNEHKTSIFDDDGNEVGKISYEARRAIRKNKISDYKPQNDDEKKVFDYLKNRRAESEKSASELKKKVSNELFSLKNNKNRLGGIKPDVVNLHDGAAVKNEYSRRESEAKKYKPDDNEIFEVSVSPSRTVKLKYGIKNKIDDIAGENGIASDLKAKRIDEAIEKLNLSEGELSDARSYAGIKKLELASASNGKNSFIKEISQPIVKFLMGTRDTAEGAAKFLKNGGKLNGDYSEEYANIEKYYEEHPDELGNDLFDTYKGGMANPKGDYLRNTAVDKMLEAYNDTTKASQFIGDAGFRSAGQMMGASALAYGSGAAEAASGATALIKNAADGTKAAKVISKAASIAPKISEVGGNGNVSRAANTAIKKVNSLSVGKALKFLNPFDNPTTVIMGMNAAQDKYDALKKMGYDDDTSKKNALFSGYVSAITEKMGYDGKPESFFFNRNGKPIAGSATASKSKNAKKLIKDYLTANVSEGVEEIYNTVFERMGDYLSKVGYVDENGHLKQRKVFGNEGIFDVKDMGENFLGGFVGGAVMGSVGVLSNIASYDTKTVHEYADEVKKQVSKSNELVEKYAKESGMETVSLPDEPDWKKASVNEINNYYEKAVDAHLNILFNENVIKNDSKKLDGAEKLIATPDDSTSAYADDEQIHDASENLAEGNAGVSVQQLESGVKKLTDNLTAEYKSSYIKNIPNYQTVYDENLRLSSTPGKVVDEQFVRTYALSYAEGLRQNNSKAYKKLSAVSDDVGGMLSDYILRNKTPQGIETNEDMSALYRTAGGLKKIINRAANAVMSANNQIYGKSDTLTEAANEISRGNYSVIKYENAGDISLSKVGEYYEAYGTDAVKLKNLLSVSTHYTERNGSKTLVAAIPAGNINEYINTLKLSANAYSAGGREFISLTPNTADTTNVSGTDERKTDAYESNSNIEVSENEISVSSKPSAQQVSEIAFVISRNPSIPLILNGNEKSGETVLFYAEEEDTSRERIENDINSYYDGVIPEIGTKIPNEYDENMKFSVDGDGYSKQLVTDFETAVKDIMTISDYSARVNAEARTAVRILENTPSVILDNIEGSANLPIVINFTKMYLAARKNGVIKGNYHNLGSDILMKLPQMISDPDMILQLGNGRLNLLSKAKTENGNNAVVSIELNSSKDIEGKNKNYNVVITLFSANDNYVRNLINKDGTEIKYAKEDLSQVNPRLYNRPATFNDKSSIDNISQNNDIVNSSIRENAENDTDIKFSLDGGGYSHVYNVEKADKGYLDYSNTDIETAIENIRNGNTNEIPSEIEVARLNSKTVEKINDVVGFDISDYKCKIEKDTLLHIEKRHGLNGKQDQSLADPKDVARMGYVINNADNVSLLKDGNGDRVVSKKYNDRNNTPCPILMISKRIDGTYCVSQVVPDSKKKTVWVTSARIQKADVGSQVLNTIKGQQLTSETPLVSSPALYNINISQNDNVVNKNIKRNLSELPSGDNSLSHTSKTRLGTVSSIDNISQNDSAVNSNIRENAGNDTDIKFSVDGDFAAKYDRWVENGGNYRQTLDVGRTSDALKSIGVPDKKITWDTAKIAKIKEKHNVDDNIIKQVPYILEEPIVIMKSLQKSSRITLCGEVYDLNNKPVMAILELNPTNAKGDILLDEIKLVSAYGKDNLQNLINKSEILYVEPNKKRTNDWLTQNRLQLPLGQTNHWYSINISQNNDVVNSNIRKNSGNDTENVKFSQDNSLDGGGGISYNDDINIPYRESVQLSEYIIAENNRNGSEFKPFGYKEIGNNFYFWRNNSKTDYDVIAQVEIDGNEDIIDAFRKGLENGEIYIDKGTKGFNDWLAAVRSGQRSNSGNNAVDTAELSNGNDDRLYPRQSSDDDGIKFARESNRNQQNTEVENYGRDDILNGDDRRTSGKSEGERGSGFREIAGNAERNAGEEQSGASTRRIYARDVKEAGGVERRTDRGVEADFVKPEYYNDEMRRIAAENDERGVVTHFILGNGRALRHGTNFRGAVRGNEVYIQADHGKYSPSQINRHEIIHRNYSTDTVLELKNRILSRLTNKQINGISERLYRDYAQKRRSFDEIFEEFVCDVLADMNDYAEMFSTETQEYWTAEEQERKGYSPSTYTESIDAGGKNVAENKIEPLAWNSDKKSVHPINAFGSNNNNISQNDSVVNNSSANAEFLNQVDSWKDGSMDKNEVFNLGNTPDVLKNIGADGLPIIMTQKVMNKITGGKHDIDLSEIKRLPQSIAEPIMLFKSATTPNAYVILTELSDKNGNSVVAALHLNRMQNRVNVNRIASVYGKENIENFVRKQAEAGNLIFADKNKSQQWSTSRGLQLPKLVQSIADNTNITQNDNIVNSSIRKNAGNDTDIRFSADENTDVNVSGDEDMSYLSEPVKNIKNDIREVRLRAEASHGKVFDRKDINEVCDSILNNINTGAVRGIEIKSKKDRTVMSVLVNRVLNSAGVDAKRKHTRALARFIAQNATAYDSKSLSAADGVDYESDKAVITSYIKHGVKLSPDAKEAVISVVGESSAKGYISMMSNENALGIDAVYDELRLVMPEYFTEDLLSDGDKMRRVMEVYTWLKEGRDLQEQKLIDIMDESDRREFTDILSQQLDDAFEMRGRESLLDLELVKERQRNEKKIKALEDKYRDKISELRSKAENKIKNSAEKKKIEVKQERYKFKSLSEAVSKYGRIKEGEKPYRETAVPRKIDKDRYVSRFARTMVEAGVTPNEALSEFEERILSGDMTYERITDEKAKNYAEEKIKRRGFLKSLEDWDEMILSNQRIGKNEMAFGQMLYNQCINAKDAKHAMKIAADLANIATQAGQMVQACQLLKQMSPDCQLYSLEQSVSKMEDEFRQQLKLLSGKNRDIDIKINESFAQEYLNAETQEERDIAMDKLLEDIAGQIPSSLKDKWDSWRYLSMLGNPRTHIRNIGGNLVFMLPVHLKNTLSYIAEKAIPKGQRTKSYIKTAESKEFAKRDYIKMKDIIQGNSGKFEGISKINELRRIYKFKPLEGLRKANFAALEWEDGIFLKHHYENALAQIMTARGYTAEFLNSGTSEARAALEAARAYAINEAQKATYRDANAAAEAISSAQRKLQNSKYFAGRAAGLALEGVVPFKKTPLNIVKRGIEYSPVGLINGVYDMAFNIKSGKTTAAEAIDKLASGLVGTALTVLGMWLASIGLVRGDGDDDKNAERLDNATGEQSYSVRIGKHSYTIDWVAPASMPFFVGVNIQKAFASDKKFTFEDIVKALVKIPDPIMSLSVLSSLSDLLSAGNYADTGAEKAAAYAWQTATSYVGQAYPTMFGQIARTIDKAKRNTYYADTENGIPDGLERFINRQLAKTPGASRLIEPKIDMWGREETYGDTWYGRFVGNTLSPGYYKEIDSTALDDELRRLNEEYEGDGSVLPPKIPKYFTYEKQKYYMNPSEYTKYSVIRGQKSFKAADELIRTDDYKNKSAEEKKKALEKCYDAAGDEARNEILKGRGIDVAEKEAEKEQSKKKSKSKSSNKRFR